jgi:hypothetical protein
MQFEAVSRVTVGDLRFKIGRQVDDVDGTERTFFRADTASNAEALRDEGDLRFRAHFNAELASAHHGAGLLAFLSAFLYFSLY